MKITNQLKQTHTNSSDDLPRSEIFKNSRSLSRDDLDAPHPVQTIEKLIAHLGISKKDLCDPEVQLDVGLKFLKGDYPVQANEQAAREWIAKAADLRLPQAAHILGTSYTFGTFTEQNSWLGCIYLKIAVDAGVSDAKALYDMVLKSHP